MEAVLARIRALIARLRDFWLDHLWADLVIAVLIVVGHITLVLFLPSTDLLGRASAPDRRAGYSATAIVVSLLGSFSSVAISQLSAAKGARADALRRQGAKDLARNWQSIFRVGMGAAMVAIVCLLIDPSRDIVSPVPVVARWVFEFCVFLSAVKFFRLSSLFFAVITIGTRSTAEADEKREPALQPVPGWADKQAS